VWIETQTREPSGCSIKSLPAGGGVYEQGDCREDWDCGEYGENVCAAGGGEDGGCRQLIMIVPSVPLCNLSVGSRGYYGDDPLHLWWRSGSGEGGVEVGGE